MTNLTIYDKLITDFTPNTPKYVFKGIAEFATEPPAIITGDNYESQARTLFDALIRCKINIFNISKINSEVRGGRSPRIKRLSEYIGESYFDYLAGLPDLVVLMDESHRYRASAGVRAINELKPVLGLEVTATPFIERSGGTVPFRNVVLDYPLGRAIADGFVKEPAVVTRKDFDPRGMSPEEIERLKLEDGIRLHEQTKVHLETFARETGQPIVKPFLLVIARDTTHAAQLVQLVQGDEFFEGRYRGKMIQVDSSQTGAAEEEMISRLLRVEHGDEPTEIVVHVNMLKEGWDVTNLYTIVPLRAANARTLIEQSIGRGLRLPYGRRTGVAAVDRLSIVAHDRFQEIVDEASRPESAIRLQALVLDPAEITRKPRTVVAQPTVAGRLGLAPTGVSRTTEIAGAEVAPAFGSEPERQVAQAAYRAIQRAARRRELVTGTADLSRPDVQAAIVADVEEQVRPEQLQIEGVAQPVDVGRVVSATIELVQRGTIDIPRILVVPRGEARAGYQIFPLSLEGLRFQPPSDELYLQYLRTGANEVLALGSAASSEHRLEDYVVSGLVSFDDVSYDDNADVLYDLAGQVVRHLRTYLDEEQARRVLRVHQREIARFVHAQMQDHAWADPVEHEVVVRQGFTELEECAYSVTEDTIDFRQSPADKSNMARYLFGGFSRSLYPVQKFHSEAERILAVILDREAEKWFRPVRGQFQISYRVGHEVREYQPDFVAETAEVIWMLEPKARNQLSDPEVVAKQEAAITWCEHATGYTSTNRGKPWRYALIPHDLVAVNKTIEGLIEASQYAR